MRSSMPRSDFTVAALPAKPMDDPAAAVPTRGSGTARCGAAIVLLGSDAGHDNRRAARWPIHPEHARDHPDLAGRTGGRCGYGVR
jgi:hypothetical protein